MDTQITLTIILLIIELVAFAWLINDMRKSKEKQILQLEESIMEQEKNIIFEIKDLKKGINKLTSN